MLSAPAFALAAAALAALLGLGSSKSAEEAAERAPRGPVSFTLTCGAERGQPVQFSLRGGPFPGLRNVEGAAEVAVIWIFNGGRETRHPLRGRYAEGRLEGWVGGLGPLRLTHARRIRITGPEGEPIHQSEAGASPRARFPRACGG